MRKAPSLTAAVFTVLLLAFQPVLAAETATGKPKGTSEAKAPEKRDAEEVRMEAVEIRGQLENPDVFYIIPRRKADLDTGSLTVDYSKDIMAPIMPEIFEAEHKTGVKALPAGK